MNSLKTQLIAAFLLVGVLGIALATLLTVFTTRLEFDRFIVRQYEEVSALVGASTDELTSAGGRGGGRRLGNERLPSENRFLEQLVRISWLSAISAIGVAMVAGVLLSRRLVRPLETLTLATKQMAGGELGTQVDIDRKDEIGRLAQSFNRMSSDLSVAHKKREQMTADIAHDLRTPLTILRGYVENIRDGTVDGSDETLTIMHEEIVHLEHLVRDLQTLSLADAGVIALEKRPISPQMLLERTGLAYVMQAKQQGVELRIEADPTLPKLHVDVERMTQVLNNLVANALRFTQTGAIVLSAQLDNEQMQLRVLDSGSGISADALPHVFDRFYQADKARQRDGDGTVLSGLGLAIARAIVQAHGGEIKVTSVSANITPTDSGTTFIIQLPRA